MRVPIVNVSVVVFDVVVLVVVVKGVSLNVTFSLEGVTD